MRRAPGEGPEVHVYLPRASVEQAEEGPREAARPAGGGETILVVDDEPSVLEILEDMLALLGYRSVGYTDGDSALAALRADPGRFDAVLSDLTMHGMTGVDVAPTGPGQVRLYQDLGYTLVIVY